MSLPPAERDAALLLDMLTWAGQAADFVRGLDEASFRASKLHQAAVTRVSRWWGRLLGVFRVRCGRPIRIFLGRL